MKIVRGCDSYDGAVGVAGRDPEIVFVREPRLMSQGELGVAGLTGFYSPVPINVIVAGVRYRCAKVASPDTRGDGTSRSFIVWDYASLEQHEDARSWEYGELVRKWGPHFFEPRSVTAPERARLIEHRVTTAILDYVIGDDRGRTEIGWLVNSDRLKDYNLARVLDPFTCFQEVAMWVGGVPLRDPSPTVEITDDRVKAAKHGFDRFSFRTGKQPPRAKR